MTDTLKKYYKWILFLIALLIPMVGEYVMFAAIGLALLGFGVVKKEYPLKTYAIQKSGLLIGLLTIAAVSSTLFSVSPKTSAVAFVRFFSGILLMLLIQWVLRKKQDILWFIQFLLFSSVLVGGYGIVQYFFKDTTMLNAWVDKALHPDISIRVTSIMQNPNNLAEFLVLVTPLTFALFLYKKDGFHKLMAAGYLLILMGCLVMTYSRSGYLGIMVAILCFIVIIEYRFIALIPVALAVAVIWMPSGLQSRLDSLFESIIEFIKDPTTIADTSIAYRINIWQGAANMLKEFWLFGVGLGNKAFSAVYPFFSLSAVSADHAHSVFLEMFLELGIIGFAVMILMVLNILRHGMVSIHQSKNRMIMYFTGACAVGLVGLSVAGVTEYVLYYHKVFYAFFVLLGLMMALYNNYRETETSSQREIGQENQS